MLLGIHPLVDARLVGRARPWVQRTSGARTPLAIAWSGAGGEHESFAHRTTRPSTPNPSPSPRPHWRRRSPSPEGREFSRVARAAQRYESPSLAISTAERDPRRPRNPSPPLEDRCIELDLPTPRDRRSANESLPPSSRHQPAPRRPCLYMMPSRLYRSGSTNRYGRPHQPAGQELPLGTFTDPGVRAVASFGPLKVGQHMYWPRSKLPRRGPGTRLTEIRAALASTNEARHHEHPSNGGGAAGRRDRRWTAALRCFQSAHQRRAALRISVADTPDIRGLGMRPIRSRCRGATGPRCGSLSPTHTALETVTCGCRQTSFDWCQCRPAS